ncbi:hypothetical protein BLA50215_05270 [Burkholderia lata]|uniref:hypothetical protein n=1 Tax=Burkholderia lata (strain ATCC 17760 / DSM 23089 / LMG 22485 / NCIMB 9086 / R18194 / 383) TaxID=482957 RepID=UPI001453B930|nr:hypothetical protein [Burkholderia lata]VWD39437.1 hypothetical protein BLA50215_05270 [Burkholderia lata]
MKILKGGVLLKYGLTFVIAMISVSVASAEVDDNWLSIDKTGKIRDCSDSSACKIIEPTGRLKKAIDDGYENLTVVNIYKDGNREIAATSAGGDRCSKFFSYDRASHRFSALKFSDRDICNFRVDKDGLISSYRLDAKQYEDIYELKNGRYQIAISDACVGCDEVSRSVYANGKISEKIIVTNQQNYAQRVPINTVVVANKAMLYDDHSDSSEAKIYLLKGDKVRLSEFNDENGLWYLVKYLSRRQGFILKWVKCKDLAICK